MENAVVRKDRIIGTNVLVFSVWEPTDFLYGHSSIQREEGQWWGRIGTKRLPEELDRLPARTDERAAKVSAWHQQEYERAYQAIVNEYPGLTPGVNCQPDMGQLVVYHSNRYPASTFERAGVRA